MKNILILIVILQQSFILFGQTNTKLIKEYLYSDGTDGNLARSFYHCRTEVLNNLEQYLNHKNDNVRANALNMLNIYEEDKTKVVRILSGKLNDKSGNVKSKAVHLLCHSNKSDFDLIAQQNVVKCLVEDNIYNSDYIELIALLKLPETIPLLKNRIEHKMRESQKTGNSTFDPWFLELTLARIGDKEATQKCVNRFEIWIRDGYMSSVTFSWLRYMGNLEAIKLFTKILNQSPQKIDEGDDILVSNNTEIAYMHLTSMIQNLPTELSSKKDMYVNLKYSHIEFLRNWLNTNERSSVIINDNTLD
jgi:hypothetical protein